MRFTRTVVLRALLGADLGFSSRRPFSPAAQAVIDSLPASGMARLTNFPAMAYVARTSGSRLVQASAVEGPFPFYGAIKTAPTSAWAALQRDSGEGSGDDQADAGTKTFEREHEMSLVANSRDLLSQVERALQRLDNGSYGICENCGNPIGKARLQAFPRATLCVSCKQREERR